MDSAQYRVLEEGREVGLGRLLQRRQRRRLEAEALQVVTRCYKEWPFVIRCDQLLPRVTRCYLQVVARAQVLRDLLDQPREGQPRDEQVEALLEPADLLQRLRPRAVPPARPLRPARRRRIRGALGRPSQRPREVGPGG